MTPSLTRVVSSPNATIVPITVPIPIKGTLLNYLKIYEEPVSTPEKMKR